MDGRDFLIVAQRLSQDQTEADWRTAAGRAYYALMQEAREILEKWGFTPLGREDIHRFVRLRFTYAQDPTLKQIASRWNIWRAFAMRRTISCGPQAVSHLRRHH